MTETVASSPPLVATGIEGLDDILRGRFVPNRMYLVEGDPGSGKTTLALQFLLEGVRLGEPCLFVTLSESDEELRASATSHGWSLEGLKVVEIIASEESLKPDARYTMYHPRKLNSGRRSRPCSAKPSGPNRRRVGVPSDGLPLHRLRLRAGKPDPAVAGGGSE